MAERLVPARRSLAYRSLVEECAQSVPGVCGNRAAEAVSAPRLQGCRLLPVRCGAKSRLCACGLEWPAGLGWGR